MWMRTKKKLTQCIRKPKDSIAREEEGAFARPMANGAGDLKVALAHRAVGLCFAISFRFSGSPWTARISLSTSAGLAGGVLVVASRPYVRLEVLQARRDGGLGRLLARPARLERAPDGAAALGVRVRPDRQADAVIRDGVADGGVQVASRACRCPCRGAVRIVAKQTGGA